ncbi:MAG: hypothetical protein ACE5GY_02240 [Thermodesulfobacteriota bacterium]
MAALALPLAAMDSMAGHETVGLENGGPAQAALIEEMRTLDAVFREIVSSVALGDADGVAKAIDRMHGKKERTEQALDSGKIRLPKHPEKTALFRKLDGEFHAGLKMLENAALRGDRKAMVGVTQRLIARCAGCHATFRK